MLKKHSLITAAILATLTISACGKKKDVLPAPPQDSQKQSDQKTDPEAPGGGGLQDPSGGGDSDFNPGTPGEDQEENNTDNTDDSENETPPKSGHSSRPSTRPGLPPPVVDTEPVPTTPEAEVPNDYVFDDENNVYRDDFGKRYTGGAAGDGLLYSSSSTDELLTFLRARNNTVAERYRRLNIEAAASVVFAKKSTDSKSGNGVVTLKVQEGDRTVVYNLSGPTASGPQNVLKAVGAGNGERTTGTRAIEGTWKCVDADGGCENVFVRMKIGSGDDSAIINVVFRSSKMSLWFSLPGRSSGNPEYDRLADLAVNTIQKNQSSSNRLRSAAMSSWEVVNGRSGVTLMMKGYNDELIAVAGPLLTPESGTKVNVTLARLGADQEDSLDMINKDSSSLKYQNSIGDARLVANNSLGQVRVTFKMRKRANFAQDQFAVTFMRRLKPLVELTDKNLK